MPVFDYKCEKCETRYDVYHKSKEVQEDVICPACGSPSHKKLMSVPAAPVMSNGKVSCSDASCESGGCCDGACTMN